MARKVVILDPATGRLRQSTNDVVEVGDAVTNIRGVPVSSAAAISGHFLRFDGVQWVYIAIPDINQSGDVMVDNIRGITVTSALPEENQVLRYNSVLNRWEPADPATIISGGSQQGASITVRELDGSPSIDEVSVLEFTNGTVTSMGGGVARITVSGGSAGSSGPDPGGLLYLWSNFY